MVRRILALFRRKPKAAIKVAKKHPLEYFLTDFSDARKRVRAIKAIRAKTIQKTGETTPHIERSLDRALAKRKTSFENLRKARSQLRTRSHE
jgi:hypothetical protein